VGATFGDIVERLRRSTVAVQAHRGGGGSGVIWASDGRIITNAHVVAGGPNSGALDSDRVDVELWDGRRFPGRIVRTDRRRDLAALDIETSGLPAVATGNSNALRVGELVIAVGNPMGFIGAASTGVVHGFSNGEWVVSQLRLAPGNSGGPLANARGELVGINTMITRGPIAGGLAFAIPSRSVTQFLSAKSGADSGLGVVVRPVPAAYSGQYAAQQIGLIVLEVIPHSPADHASLLQGDILVGARGKRFQSVQDLEMAIRASSGRILELQFRRGASANIRTVVVQMAAPPVKAA